MNEFEKWALSKELRVERHPNPEKGFAYFDIETEMFWECWQAARGGWICMSEGFVNKVEDQRCFACGKPAPTWVAYYENS